MKKQNITYEIILFINKKSPVPAQAFIIFAREALGAIAKPDFTVILYEGKDFKSLKIRMVRIAQNEIFGQTGVLLYGF